VEIQDISPSPTMQKSMELQAAAERERKATVTKAEGDKQAAILEAEARLESAKRDAEAQVRLAERLRRGYPAHRRRRSQIKSCRRCSSSWREIHRLNEGNGQRTGQQDGSVAGRSDEESGRDAGRSPRALR
jgi:hypothetical protein